MHWLTPPTVVVLVLVIVTNGPRSGFNADGFTTQSGVTRFRTFAQCKIDLSLGTNARRETTTKLLGILDDIMEEDVNDGLEQSNGESDEQVVELYHSLIFASDLQSEISKRLDECTDPIFLEYLNSSLDSSQDEEEKQGLTELLDHIVKVEKAKKAADDQEKAVIAAKAKEDIEEESEGAEATAKSATPLSNADVLRKANEIDAAIALSDDEKPSDFISDCREVVNLSRGFNDSGQMRVGGG